MNGYMVRRFSDGAKIGRRLVHYNGKTFVSYRLTDGRHVAGVYPTTSARWPRTFGTGRGYC